LECIKWPERQPFRCSHRLAWHAAANGSKIAVVNVPEANVAQETYLSPYLRAVERYAGGFGSLLWASEKSQRQRFDALCRVQELNEKLLLDAGCGRADLLGYLLERLLRPAEYVGLEALDALADQAESRHYPRSRILRGDFVREPLKLFVGAEVIVFSGSLNTLLPDAFYATLRHAFEAAGEAVVFNFLCSPALAGQDYLVWHHGEKVLAFAQTLGGDVRTLCDYLPGDCTVAIMKQNDGSE
jgi:hypothetical protein